MVDWSKAIRTVRSQRRLYVTGWDRGYRLVDSQPHAVNTGFRYNGGEPVDEGCPWGEIENIPESDVILSIEIVRPGDAVNHTLREKRRAEFAEAAERENAGNPLWGMF